MTSLALDWGLYAERREGNFYVPLDRSAGEVRVPSSDGKHHLRVWLDRDAWWVAPGVVVQPWMTKAAYPLRLGEIIAQSFGLGVIERRAVPALERLLAEDRKAIAFRQLLLEALIESRPGCAVCVLAIESLTDWGQEVSDALREVVPASDVLALGAHEQWNGDWLKMNLLFTASEGDAAHVAQVARDAVARRIQPMGRAWPSVSVGVGLPRLESSARAQVSAALDALCAARERGGHRLVTARAGDAPNWAAADLRLRALQDDAIEARDDETRWARYGDALAEVGDGRAPLFAATAQPWPEGELGDTREPRQAMPSEGIGLLEPPELSGKNAGACTWHHGHVVSASFV